MPRTKSPLTVSIHLTEQEVRILSRVAYYYLTLRPLRSVMRLLAPQHIRSRLRFVAEESKWLKKFMVSTRDEMRREGVKERDVAFTVRALVAFWGRLLASVNTPRSRRKLSAREIERREALAGKLQEALGRLARHRRATVEEELETRRVVEQVWMRERLGLPRPEFQSPVAES